MAGCHAVGPSDGGRKAAHTLATIIADLDFRACRLVTLSACETGITDVRQSPDEFLGLPAGLFQAGAPNVVSTLWPVNDLSTMLLMERFYRNLFDDDGKVPRPSAGALRAAQLWLREATAEKLHLADHYERHYHDTRRRDANSFRRMRYYRANGTVKPFAHPYYWAGFTFSGG